MRDWYHKIRTKLDINGRDWGAFLLSLLLAFTVWLIHNLSLTYSTYLSVPVIARCEIIGHADRSTEPARVVARCRTTGYEALLHKLFESRQAKTIVFDEDDLRQKGGEIYYLSRDRMSDYANAIYGEQTKIEFFMTDTLFFRFPSETYKKVPVIPVSTLNMSSQYIPLGKIKLEPDSVLIYGSPNHLENVGRVYTEHIELANISSSVQGLANIEQIEGIRMSQTVVHFYMDVTRFVEISAKVKVETRNVPLDQKLVSNPAYVDVRFVCTFPPMSEPQDSVSLYVDYVDDFLASRDGRCAVHASRLPAGVIKVLINDPVVTCTSYQK